jgi:ribosomal protein S18 acetylase RimI-like enzyme
MINLLVSYFEAVAPPPGPVLDAPIAGSSIDREKPDAADYLPLYRAIGEAVQWDARLRMPIAELETFLQDPATHIYVLRLDGSAVGLCEFDAVGRPEVELCNFGLIPAAQSRGLGPYLLDHALRAVWRFAPRRVWLHTDTNDHPRAETIYSRAGFRLYRQQVESFPD